MHSAATYATNRQPQLAAAMTAGALATMPWHEATLRGSAASKAIETAAEATTTSAMASAAGAATATAIDAATNNGGGTSDITESMMPQIAVQMGMSAATLIANQRATRHALHDAKCKKKNKTRARGQTTTSTTA